MSKSLNARCIRRWQVQFRDICDSKASPHWRKRHLRGCIRECALTTVHCMVERMSEDSAIVDYQGDRHCWSPEFSAWYSTRREQYRKDALGYLNHYATNDEIDDEIQNELGAWND
nr:hypothetical protein [uncultured Enterobacter sp.]